MRPVDFYLLPDGDMDARDLFACRLVEKAWRSDHRVFVHTADSAATSHFDALLWRFRPGSFVPHQRVEENQPMYSPVLISHRDARPAADCDVMVNLGAGVPACSEEFERVVEIVIANRELQARAREHWRHYRERGFTPRTRDLRKS